ncbi:S41 family peptidase [Hymenobacter psychrotolerans]|uniref:Tricorn protease C1 domain-containing protein n=1 Tax=Hymenobacter psychrotolerans DSM 18569 TaxID=1121959 RepID=A0A1M6YLY5_9BACT|nr:S41 family peptidase [Hymenobacter psychrotolerans]SHL19278.1 Tricorn protease C1 domain-containing protein [Hymenobacter psychrotolerans DSM 18569]
MKFSLTLALLWLLLRFPAFAQAPAPTSLPEQSFEQFWQAFRDNYAFFELKKMDWDASYRRFRPRITPTTPDDTLVQVLRQLVEPLHDGHITISRGETVLYKGESTRNTFKQTFRAVQPEFWRVAYGQLQQAGFGPVQGLGPDFKGKQVLYTSRNGAIGYLHLTRSFADISGAMGTEAQELKDRRKLEKLFAQALKKLAGCQVLLLDVRDNGGGHSGYELASHFTQTRYLANYKALRRPGSDQQFTEPQPVYVEPAAGPRFTGPLLLLTSDQTASAAEDLTIALSQLPQVTQVGTATKGMLSDMHSVQLPNGLDVTLSNQRYTMPDGQPLEDVGVQPDSQVENTLADLDKKQDAVLRRALELARTLSPTAGK